MVSRWNSRPGWGTGAAPGDSLDTGSLSPGTNLDRRRFVELAVGAAAGVTLVGLPTPEAQGRPVADPCRGEGRSGPAAEVLEYEDLPTLHRVAR